MKITAHDGSSKKGDLIDGICKAEAMVSKIIESKEAFFLVTDHRNMDKMLKEEVREYLANKGLQIQYPPEYEAARTVMIKNVDSMIAALSEAEIAAHIDKVYKTKKIIKIPNNSHIIKVIFHTSEIADQAVKEGLSISFQKYDGRNIEKEEFVPVVPCYRCYSYEHQKRYCSKPADYKVCSNCAAEGHTFNDCKVTILKCINCGKDHRTLAAKCAIRKTIIRNKIKEKRARSRSKTRGETVSQSDMMRAKLPENYLAVMAATITIADKREAEVPGIFNFIVKEMLKANGMPLVKFPESVISDYKQKSQESAEAEKESKKRQRSEETDGVEIQVAPKKDRPVEYVFDLVQNKFRMATPIPTPTPTPRSTPQVSPMPSRETSPVPPTPHSTPTVTPLPTPQTSPQRPSGVIPKQTKLMQQKPQPQRETDPGLILVVRSEITNVPTNFQQIKKELTKEKIMKLVYTNAAFSSEQLKKNIKQDKYDLTKVRKIPVVLEHFNQIKSGGSYKIESLERIQRK